MPVKIRPATGAGSVALEAANGVSTDFTLTLPGTTGTVLVSNSSSQTLFPDGTVSAPSISNDGDSNTGIYFPAADTIGFVEGGVESMRLDSSGRLTVGATTYSGLDVGQLAQFNAANIAQPSGGGIVSIGSTSTAAANLGGTLAFTANTGQAVAHYTVARLAGRLTSTSNYGGYLQFETTDSAGAYQERMRIDASGNVGIGSTTPTGTRLYINGGSLFTGGPGSYGVGISGSLTSGKIGTYGTNTAAVINTYFDDSTLELSAGVTSGFVTGISITARSGSAYGDTIRFVTRGTGSNEAARIDASGNLLVGTTSTISSSRAVISKGNDAQLTVNASDSGSGVYSTISFANQGVVKTQIYWLSSNDRFIIQNGTGGVYLARDGTTWTANSDERVKIINEPISDAINKVNQLRSVIGRYKNDAQDKRRAFLIAQDVQSVLPEAVDDRDPELLGVSYTDVIPLLVASIKELAAKNADLEARLAALESK